MNLSDLQSIVDNWIKTVGVRYFSELTNTAILTEEVGEVARLMARIYGEQSFKTSISVEDQKIQLADELADVIWVIVCLANQTDVDLTQAITRNIQKKTNRDKIRHVNNPKLA